MKPTLIRTMNLPPLLNQKYTRYLPTAFDDSLTILEKLNNMLGYLNEANVVTNEMIDKWNEVYEWVTNDGLRDSLEITLDDWLQIGKLATIINQTILGSKAKIVVGKDEPTNKDGQTFWFQEVVREV